MKVELENVLPRDIEKRSFEIITEELGVLTLLIIAATMFLKQHTILDVVVALAMARICWFFMYRYKVQTVVEYEEV